MEADRTSGRMPKRQCWIRFNAEKNPAENTKFIRVSNMFEGGTRIQLSKKRTSVPFFVLKRQRPS